MGKGSENNKTKVAAIFPKGEAGPAENFTGNAWNTPLVANDSTYNMVVGNVYFEPGARSNWHIHPSGQVLIITDDVGYHQVKGEPRKTIKKAETIIASCDARVDVRSRAKAIPARQTASKTIFRSKTFDFNAAARDSSFSSTRAPPELEFLRLNKTMKSPNVSDATSCKTSA
jgi:hypothetical protein